MFRNPNGKVLCHIFDHAVYHDLEHSSPYEKGLIFLLMSISGFSDSPDSRYGFNGAMQIHFPDAPAAISELRNRGYLAESAPIDFIISSSTVPEIKAILKSYKLPVGGKRADLVNRLESIFSPDVEEDLRSNHSYWWPTDLGFELIYSLYVLWEQRQSNLLEAMADLDLDAMIDAYQYMPNSIGFWDDTPQPAPFSDSTLKIIRSSSALSFSFQYICGFMPEFHLSSMPEFISSNQEEECLKIKRAVMNQHIERYRMSRSGKIRWICKDNNPECIARANKVYWIDSAPPCPAHVRCKCRYVGVVELCGEVVPVDGE